MDEIIIDLDNDVALVLFEFLLHINDKELKEIFEDQAKQKARWILQGQLEEQLAN